MMSTLKLVSRTEYIKGRTGVELVDNFDGHIVSYEP